MIYVLIWIGLGIIAQSLYMLYMYKHYKDVYLVTKEDKFFIIPQIIMAVLAGPISLFALAIVLGLAHNEDDEDE